MDELSPRQIQFLRYWLDPKEKGTFGNAYASAIKAQYSEDYAKVLASRDLEWLSENVKRKTRIVDKAESNLEALLDEADKRVKADMTKFALSRLKREDYSEKTEVEHSGEINTLTDEQRERIIKRIIDRRTGTGEDGGAK